MRAKYVPVRLAAAALAVAASAGCMSVGDDEGNRATPSHSAQRRGDGASDGGTAVNGVGPGRRGTSDGKHARVKPGRSASGSASPSAGESGSAAPEKPGKDGSTGKQPGPGKPSPTKEQPTPTRPAPEPTPTRETPPPSPEPSTAEPSSSAHPEPEPQLVERREPAPRAGIAA
ncbi:hypothetical protein QFZ75_003710 [Streptomyces sp. V3I8]|uniref:hypothetical protein n=1 Tax=Streptomyces sp. V3I8 TaxID=3042279 RepID=UPI0027875885|nr:hypothetical protein [Streptomyces sp. V3I8]MDQ1037294.1 hypothetical protein [Streptomyces sp. V3I8]